IVRIQARLEHAVEAARPVLPRRPVRFDQKTEVIQRVNQPRLFQTPRTIEIVGVKDVRKAQRLFEVLARIPPEPPRALEIPRSPEPAEIRLLAIERPGSAFRIPKDISYGRIQKVFVPRLRCGHLADEPIGEITAARLRLAGLADVETDPHAWSF